MHCKHTQSLHYSIYVWAVVPIIWKEKHQLQHFISCLVVFCQCILVKRTNQSFVDCIGFKWSSWPSALFFCNIYVLINNNIFALYFCYSMVLLSVIKLTDFILLEKWLCLPPSFKMCDGFNLDKASSTLSGQYLICKNGNMI